MVLKGVILVEARNAEVGTGVLETGKLGDKGHEVWVQNQCVAWGQALAVVYWIAEIR